MTTNEIRAKYWKARAKLEALPADAQAHDDARRQVVELLQAEMLTEMAAQLSDMNLVLARIGLVNFEELALRLDLHIPKEKKS